MLLLGIFSASNLPYLIGAGVAFVIGILASVEEVGKFFTLLFNLSIAFFLVTGLYFLLSANTYWWDFSPFLMALSIVFGGGIGFSIAKGA